MGKHQIVTGVQSSAAIEVVWQVLTDVERWPDWAPVGKATIEREGAPERLGVGMVRRVKPWPFSIVEEIIESEAPRHHAYAMQSGLPFRGYRGDVTLTANEDGTHIRWESTFDGAWPGAIALVKPGLTVALRRTAKNLARHAERQTAKT